MTRLLGATLVSAATAAVLAVGTSAVTNEKGHVVGGFAAATWAGSSISLVLIVSAVSALYSAYLQMNKVYPGLGGSRRGWGVRLSAKKPFAGPPCFSMVTLPT